MQEVIAANAALLLIEKLLPIIAERVKAGEVPVEEQLLLRNRYDRLRELGDAAFAESHWQVQAERQLRPTRDGATEAAQQLRPTGN